MSKEKNNKEEKEFPGYPHYPASEDILNQPGAKRVDVDVENLSRSNTQTSAALPDKSVKVPSADEQALPLDDIEIVPGTDADVTEDDLLVLGEKDADFGRRDELAVTGDDLDVPGSENDDANEDIGEEDEENNYYSLGGDAHDDLEEDKG
ncbi:MAG: hypothetical protein H0W75_07450 [Chitinophagaceae bacterium]|nr:hypothetical protein [Chitinophagaceae bacterium]